MSAVVNIRRPGKKPLKNTFNLPLVLTKLGQDTTEDPEYTFFCPACGTHHWFSTTGREPNNHCFNGDMHRPTVSPAIITVTGKHRCCLYIRGGYLQYLPESTHDLAGQTIKMENLK